MQLCHQLVKEQVADDESSVDEVEDASADRLSHVGTAAYDALRKHHSKHHHEQWNVTEGKWIGRLHNTPREAFTPRDTHDLPTLHHDAWLPEKIGEIIARTENWCDIMSLAPPDGKFLEAFKKALATICENNVFGERVIVRMMFGNILGMPIDCDAVTKALTKDLPADAKDKMRLWVGSWRKGASWNHAKIVAVDGKYLWTGGHNLRDKHYLQKNPVGDLSLELEGHVAVDGHYYANAQWGYIIRKQSTIWGHFVDKHVPDSLDVPRRARVTVTEWPSATTAEFPPSYKHKKLKHIMSHPTQGDVGIDAVVDEFVPIITVGRYGVITKKDRPADDAFVAMIDSAQRVVRFVLQDLGPVVIPNTKLALPGCVWPKEYLNAIARVLWKKNVDIEIILSNPGSIPGDVGAAEGLYGNGWSCIDVAAEIIKAIQKQFPDAYEGDLRLKVQDNLRICFLRLPNGSTKYSDGGNVGLHAKHFIVDDTACYIGSQNLYICDLAEWGVVIDHPETVQQMMDQYWHPAWKTSYLGKDVDVDSVMDGLKIDRSAPSKLAMTHSQRQETRAIKRANHGNPQNELLHKDDQSSEEESDSDTDGWNDSHSEHSEAEA